MRGPVFFFAFALCVALTMRLRASNSSAIAAELDGISGPSGEPPGRSGGVKLIALAFASKSIFFLFVSASRISSIESPMFFAASRRARYVA